MIKVICPESGRVHWADDVVVMVSIPNPNAGLIEDLESGVVIDFPLDQCKFFNVPHDLVEGGKVFFAVSATSLGGVLEAVVDNSVDNSEVE